MNLGYYPGRVNRFVQPYASAEDYVKKLQAARLFGQRTLGCSIRCGAQDCITTIWDCTWNIDKEKGTHYHDRFKEWLRYVQRKDIAVSMGVLDPKGDRSTPFPSKQKKS